MLMILYCFFLLLSFANSHPSPEPIPPEISLHRGMWVLQGWGLGNMATSIPIAIKSLLRGIVPDEQITPSFTAIRGFY